MTSRVRKRGGSLRCEASLAVIASDSGGGCAAEGGGRGCIRVDVLLCPRNRARLYRPKGRSLMRHEERDRTRQSTSRCVCVCVFYEARRFTFRQSKARILQAAPTRRSAVPTDPSFKLAWSTLHPFLTDLLDQLRFWRNEDINAQKCAGSDTYFLDTECEITTLVGRAISPISILKIGDAIRITYRITLGRKRKRGVLLKRFCNHEYPTSHIAIFRACLPFPFPLPTPQPTLYHPPLPSPLPTSARSCRSHVRSTTSARKASKSSGGI